MGSFFRLYTYVRINTESKVEQKAKCNALVQLPSLAVLHHIFHVEGKGKPYQIPLIRFFLASHL